MMTNPFFWLAATLACIAIQGIYTMLEMAAVSFNRVRLEYYVNRGDKIAIWLQYLLQKPARLFGTTMLGVNVALQVGSQCSREFFLYLHLDPDIAIVPQIFLVVILAELVPLFAAHRYAEHVATLVTPLIYMTYRLIAPLIWVIGSISKLINKLIGSKRESFESFLSREELQKILESHEEDIAEGNEFNLIVSNIFSLTNKRASHSMAPLATLSLAPSNTTVSQFYDIFSSSLQPFIPIFHKDHSNIVAVAFPQDLVRLSDNKIVRDFSRPPWFITSNTPLSQILKQFRKNNQTVAVVLDANGSAVGILTLRMILEEIFGDQSLQERRKPTQTTLIERTVPGNTKISDFNREYGVSIPSKDADTLAQLMITCLEHPPEQGESVIAGQFEFIAEETTLLGIKWITVKTLD